MPERAEASVAPGGWFDAPPAHDPEAGDILWMSRAFKDAEDDSLLSTWSAPVRITGSTGPTADVTAALAALETELLDAIDDGIDLGEARKIEDRIVDLTNHKTALDARYAELMTHDGIDLLNPYRDNLANASVAFGTAHTSLINAINTATANGVVTSGELTSINSALATYRTTLATLSQRIGRRSRR